MSNVEKYGLLVLFILCAVILGVGVFGDDGTSKGAGWQAKEAAAKLDANKSDDAGKSDDVGKLAEKGEKTPLAGSGDRSDRGGRASGLEPEPDRDQTFPDDGNQGPRVLDPKGDAAGPKGDGGVQPVASDDRIKIQPRDTFTSIAVRELGSDKHVEALMKANPEVDARKLIPGRWLQRPKLAEAKPRAGEAAAKPDAGQKYRVQPGDSLDRLSRRFYGSSKHVAYLARANGMRATDVLQAKREILIPPAPGKADGVASNPEPQR